MTGMLSAMVAAAGFRGDAAAGRRCVYAQEVTIIVVCVAGAVLFGLIVWAGTGMVRSAEGGAGVGNALGGGLADVFDPGQGRAQRDVAEQMEKTELAPTPRDDDRPVRIDLSSGVVRIRRP